MSTTPYVVNMDGSRLMPEMKAGLRSEEMRWILGFVGMAVVQADPILDGLRDESFLTTVRAGNPASLGARAAKAMESARLAPTQISAHALRVTAGGLFVDYIRLVLPAIFPTRRTFFGPRPVNCKVDFERHYGEGTFDFRIIPEGGEEPIFEWKITGLLP